MQAWDRYAYANNNPLYYTDPDGHFAIPVAIIAIALVALKVIDYGWTTYDIVNSASVALDTNNTPEVRQEAVVAAAIAIGAELLEPDEISPVAVPLDDIVRHGDDVAEIFYKEAVKNPDSTFAVLGKYLKGNKNSYEAVSEIFGGTHLNLERFDDFKKTFGEDKFWDLINERFIHEIGGEGKPVWLTEVYDELDTITGGLKKEMDILINQYNYKFKPGSHWLLPE